MPRPYIKVNARGMELAVANALGIEAASFASGSGTSFGDVNEVTELVEVPSLCLGSETGMRRAKI